ncbi:unnamed protein product [Caenorhabditis auriculariae]|uniref:Receptor L-domain domain-containing protein n=1 Tax=Caenorhabditis auriculariae TaxID=2777116 RepID=A0A8S1HUM9_9PELO|nr:unnamed protein product [Caenorhabditis auriculariae]
MAWSLGTKVPLIVYTAILFLGVAAADSCCKRSVLCYTTGTAVPPECVKSTCFEASIHIEKPDVNSAQFLPYFPTTTKIGTLTIIDSKDIAPLMFKSLVEVVHKGLGPAIYLEDARLDDSSFLNFQTITVDDIRPYCVNKDLVVVKGNSKEIWKDRLESVANKMLSKCSTLTTTVATTTSIVTTTTTKTTKMAGNQTTSLRSSTNSPLVCAPAQTNPKAGAAVDEDKVCPINYILVAVAVVALLIMILGLVIVYIWASRMAALKEKQEKKTEIALASISSYATQLICTIMATQSEHDHKILESIPLFRPSKVARLS